MLLACASNDLLQALREPWVAIGDGLAERDLKDFKPCFGFKQPLGHAQKRLFVHPGCSVSGVATDTSARAAGNVQTTGGAPIREAA